MFSPQIYRETFVNHRYTGGFTYFALLIVHATFCIEPRTTGSSKWNQKLSEARAQAVYDALVKEGVSKDQLELVGFGGTDNMFGKNFLNRVVILE